MHTLTYIAVGFASSLDYGGDEKPPGFDSPEVAFRAYVTGAVTEDFDLMLSALTRESTAYHIALSIFSAAFLFGHDPAMRKLLRDHGLEPAAEVEEQNEPDEKELVEAMLKIKDPGKLMKKIADRHLQLAKLFAEPDNGPADIKPPSKEDSHKIISTITLCNKTIAEDSATASVKMAPPAKNSLPGIPDTIAFRRVDNRWYCDIDPR